MDVDRFLEMFREMLVGERALDIGPAVTVDQYVKLTLLRGRGFCPTKCLAVFG